VFVLSFLVSLGGALNGLAVCHFGQALYLCAGYGRGALAFFFGGAARWRGGFGYAALKIARRYAAGFNFL